MWLDIERAEALQMHTRKHTHTHTHRREELGKEIGKWTGIVKKAADMQLAQVVDGSEKGEGSN